MTEQLFPDEVVNDLFDGTLPVADVPATINNVANLVRAARQGATGDELDGIAVLMRRFSAEVAGADEVVPVTTPRSSPMIATRITRRAAAIVAITLLAAGTAAAAAGGALPSFTASVDSEVVEDVTTTAAETSTTEADVSTTQEEVVEEEKDPTVEVVAPVVEESTTTLHDPETADHYGKCTAWTNGAEKKITNPAFAELQAAADSEAVSIDEFCDATIAAKKAERDAKKAERDARRADDADDADESDDDADEVESDDDDSNDDDSNDDDSDDAERGQGNGHAGRGEGHGKRG